MSFVVLITGPAGAGKTTLATLIGQQPGWTMLSEDVYWGRLPRDPHMLRTDAEKSVIQAQVMTDVQSHLARGTHVALEFIIYEDPPQPILYYQHASQQLGAHVDVYVLRPALATLMARQAHRGHNQDTQLSEEIRIAIAVYQLRCLDSLAIDPRWVIDNTHLSPEDVMTQRMK